MMKHKRRKISPSFRFAQVLAFALAMLFAIPLWLMVSGACSDQAQLAQMLAPLRGGADGFAVWPLLPRGWSLQGFWTALQDTQFLKMYTNSIKLALFQLLGQLILGTPSAWALSKFCFRGRSLMFSLYILVMLLPAQVTMVSTFLAVRRLHWLNTLWSVAVPGAFATLPVFIMKRNFDAIPDSLLEAAATEGASAYRVFWHIGLPLGRPGILAAMLLSFTEIWSALEQPMVYLRDKTLWPLSLYLPKFNAQTAGDALAAALLIGAPTVILFAVGQKYFVRGVQASALKG